MKNALQTLRPIVLTLTAASMVFVAGISLLGFTPAEALGLVGILAAIVFAYVYGEYRGAQWMAEALAWRDELDDSE